MKRTLARFFVAGFAVSLGSTNSASSATRPSGYDAEVVSAVRVPLGAMSCCCGSSGDCVSTKDVLASCDDLHVVRIYAERVSAQMIDRHSGRDVSYEVSVGSPVSETCDISRWVEVESAVAVWICGSNPNPARPAVPHAHLVPEPPERSLVHRSLRLAQGTRAAPGGARRQPRGIKPKAGRPVSQQYTGGV